MKSPHTTGILFIHGAGLGGWIWNDLSTKLAMPTLAVDLPARNKPKEQRAQLSLEAYASDVMNQVNAWQVDKIIVVAHSLGGVIGLEVAARLESKLAGFIAVCAATPKSGGSFISALPFPQRIIMPLVLRLAGTQPPAASIKAGLCNDLSEAQATEVIEKFTPESAGVFTDKTHYKELTVPSLYIRTTKDKEYSLSMQTKLAQNLPNAQIADVDAGHLPMLSKPGELSELIASFVRTI